MLHVVGLPHTSVNKDFGICAYTQKLYKFMQMFPDSTLYANAGTVFPHVEIFSKAQMDRLFDQYEWYKTGEVYKVSYDVNLPYWQEFNNKVIEKMRERIQPHDIILNIAGHTQKIIADAFPNNITTEFGIGYEGIFSDYKVFESYAWMHHVYGLIQRKDGAFYDAVIPNYFDPKDFPKSSTREDYLLFMSRPIERKGLQIAKDIAKFTGKRLVVAGKEKVEGENVEWVGYADPELRGRLMSRATAVLMPTIYIEPFGGVGVEAQFCGTPVISTDWGAFPETIEQGVSGYRCRTLKEFIDAVDKVQGMDYEAIRQRANRLYSLDAIKPQYERYFNSLLTLFDKGWYQL